MRLALTLAYRRIGAASFVSARRGVLPGGHGGGVAAIFQGVEGPAHRRAQSHHHSGRPRQDPLLAGQPRLCGFFPERLSVSGIPAPSVLVMQTALGSAQGQPFGGELRHCPLFSPLGSLH